MLLRAVLEAVLWLLAWLGPPAFLLACWGASIWAAWHTGERAAKHKWRSEVVKHLSQATSAEIQHLVGELEPWAIDSAWERVLNY